MRRALFLVAAISASACGLIVGIDTDLGVAQSSAPTDSSPPDTGPDPREASVDAASDVDATTPLNRPPEGTYLYRQIGGKETVKYAGSTMYSNPVTVDVVYDGPSCFFVKLHLRSAYKDDYRFCLDGPEMRLDRYERSMLRPNLPQAFTLSTSYACAPPNAVYLAVNETPPTTGLYDCYGANPGDPADTLHVQGHYQTSEDGKFKVGTDDVPIRKSTDHQDFLKKGAKNASGTADMTWSFAKGSGMLVELTRNWSTTYGYENGSGAYDETGLEMSLLARPGELDAGADADADAN